MKTGAVCCVLALVDESGTLSRGLRARSAPARKLQSSVETLAQRRLKVSPRSRRVTSLRGEPTTLVFKQSGLASGNSLAGRFAHSPLKCLQRLTREALNIKLRNRQQLNMEFNKPPTPNSELKRRKQLQKDERMGRPLSWGPTQLEQQRKVLAETPLWPCPLDHQRGTLARHGGLVATPTRPKPSCWAATAPCVSLASAS